MNRVTTPPNGTYPDTHVSKIKGDSDPTETPPEEPSSTVDYEFELSLEDTLAQQRRGVAPQSGPKVAVSGYNPYDTPVGSKSAQKPIVAPDPKRKPTDLRKLSEWIQLQRQVQALKKQSPGSDSNSE